MTKAPSDIHDGKIIGMTDDKLTTTCGAGKQHCYTVAADAKVTCDGKAAGTAELKAGMQVKVTTDKNDGNVATHVDCCKQTPAAAKKA